MQTNFDVLKRKDISTPFRKELSPESNLITAAKGVMSLLTATRYTICALRDGLSSSEVERNIHLQRNHLHMWRTSRVWQFMGLNMLRWLSPNAELK